MCMDGPIGGQLCCICHGENVDFHYMCSKCQESLAYWATKQFRSEGEPILPTLELLLACKKEIKLFFVLNPRVPLR